MLLAATLPTLFACGESKDGAQAQVAEADSTLQSILGATAATPPPAHTSPRLSAQEQAARPLDINEIGYDEGPPDAVVRVIEISDFGCGYCRRFHEDIYPTVKEVYVDGGYLMWKFLPYVMGIFPNSLEATTAAECGGEQDQFYPMRTRIFQEQSRWKSATEPLPFFADIAAEEGLDMARYNACMSAGWRDNRLRSNLRFGQSLGVRGTPTFIIDGRPLAGTLPMDQFRDILDAALRQRGITPPAR